MGGSSMALTQPILPDIERGSDEEQSATLGTVARVVRLLQCFGESEGEITIKAASERIGLPPSTVHRLLNLLVKDGFVQRNPPGAGYRVGPELLGLSGRIVASSDLPTIALPVIREIVAAFSETCVIARYLPDAHQVMPVLFADCPHRVRLLIEPY